MDHTLMIALLLDFYTQAKLEDPSEVAAWCQAKGIDQVSLEAKIVEYQARHGTDV